MKYTLKARYNKPKEITSLDLPEVRATYTKPEEIVTPILPSQRETPISVFKGGTRSVNVPINRNYNVDLNTRNNAFTRESINVSIQKKGLQYNPRLRSTDPLIELEERKKPVVKPAPSPKPVTSAIPSDVQEILDRKSGQQMPSDYYVLSKTNNQLYHFNPDNSFISKTPILRGKARGDFRSSAVLDTPTVKHESNWKTATTPAGSAVFNAPTEFPGDYDYPVFFIQYNDPSLWGMHLGLHDAWNGEQQERTRRLLSEDPWDNLVSNGCVNCPEEWLRTNMPTEGDSIFITKEPTKFKKGGVITDPPYKESSMMDVKQSVRLSDPDPKYDMKMYGEMYRKYPQFYTPDQTGHTPSVNMDTGEWIKYKDHPTAWMEYMQYTLNPEVHQLGFPVEYKPNRLKYPLKFKKGGMIDDPPNGINNKTTDIQGAIEEKNYWERLNIPSDLVFSEISTAYHAPKQTIVSNWYGDAETIKKLSPNRMVDVKDESFPQGYSVYRDEVSPIHTTKDIEAGVTKSNQIKQNIYRTKIEDHGLVTSFDIPNAESTIEQEYELRNIQGQYDPSNDLIIVNYWSENPDETIYHELGHATSIDDEYGKKLYNQLSPFVQDKITSSLKDLGYENDAIYREIYARLMGYRLSNSLTPNHVFSNKEVRDFLKTQFNIDPTFIKKEPIRNAIWKIADNSNKALTRAERGLRIDGDEFPFQVKKTPQLVAKDNTAVIPSITPEQIIQAETYVPPVEPEKPAEIYATPTRTIGERADNRDAYYIKKFDPNYDVNRRQVSDKAMWDAFSLMTLPGDILSLPSLVTAPINMVKNMRFRPNPNMMYRGIGEAGYKDAIESGVFRPRQGKITRVPLADDEYQTLLKTKVFDKTYYAPGHRFNVVKQYGGKYVAEVPRESADFYRRYGGKDWSYLTEREIPIGEGRILKKDWLRGYKEIPQGQKTLMTDEVSNAIVNKGDEGYKAMFGELFPEKNFINDPRLRRIYDEELSLQLSPENKLRARALDDAYGTNYNTQLMLLEIQNPETAFAKRFNVTDEPFKGTKGFGMSQISDNPTSKWKMMQSTIPYEELSPELRKLYPSKKAYEAGGKLTVNDMQISMPSNYTEFSYNKLQELVGHEFRHNLDRNSKGITQMLGEDLQSMMKQEDEVIAPLMQPDASVKELNDIVKDYEYRMSPTEINAYLGTSMRRIMKQQGIIKDWNEVITPKHLEAFEALTDKAFNSSLRKSYDLVSNKSALINHLNQTLLSGAGLGAIYKFKQNGTSKRIPQGDNQ